MWNFLISNEAETHELELEHLSPGLLHEVVLEWPAITSILTNFTRFLACQITLVSFSFPWTIWFSCCFALWITFPAFLFHLICHFLPSFYPSLFFLTGLRNGSSCFCLCHLSFHGSRCCCVHRHGHLPWAQLSKIQTPMNSRKKIVCWIWSRTVEAALRVSSIASPSRTNWGVVTPAACWKVASLLVHPSKPKFSNLKVGTECR